MLKKHVSLDLQFFLRKFDTANGVLRRMTLSLFWITIFHDNHSFVTIIITKLSVFGKISI